MKIFIYLVTQSLKVWLGANFPAFKAYSTFWGSPPALVNNWRMSLKLLKMTQAVLQPRNNDDSVSVPIKNYQVGSYVSFFLQLQICIFTTKQTYVLWLSTIASEKLWFCIFFQRILVNPRRGREGAVLVLYTCRVIHYSAIHLIPILRIFINQPSIEWNVNIFSYSTIR
jgi:hypothetical protein